MLPKILTEIGTAITHRRGVLQLTQEKLSEVSGVALRTIREVEQGTGNPSLGTLIRLFEVLGLDIIVQMKSKALPGLGLSK